MHNMLRGKVKQIITERDYYQHNYQDLEDILQKYGIDTQRGIQHIEKDLIAIQIAKDVALEQLEERTIERDFERDKVQNLIIQHEEERKMEVVNKKSLNDIPSRINSNLLFNDENITSTNHNLYLQRVALEATVSRIKGLRRSWMDTTSSSTSKTLKEKEFYSSNDKILLQRNLLYRKHYMFDTSLPSTTTTGAKSSMSINNAFAYLLPIINPYTSSIIQSNTTNNRSMMPTTEEEKDEMHVQKIALDLAISKMHDMDKQMKYMSIYNERLRRRVQMFEKNVSYAWKEYD